MSLQDCKCAVTLVDYFSKWPKIWFCKNITFSVITLFLTNVFSPEEMPSVIVTENGPQLGSHKFSQFLNKCSSEHYFLAICNPRANGAVKKFNTVAKETLLHLST